MSSISPLPVVCAVIVDAAGRVLLAQRPAHKHLGLKWEFPGGKVEPNEEPEHALHREIREELGCEIVIAQTLAAVAHDYGTVRIILSPFRCELDPLSPPPRAHEHSALEWVAREALSAFDLAPADRRVASSL